MGRDLSTTVRIATSGVMLDGDLVVPGGASGMCCSRMAAEVADTVLGTGWSPHGCRPLATGRY